MRNLTNSSYCLALGEIFSRRHIELFSQKTGGGGEGEISIIFNLSSAELTKRVVKVIENEYIC